MPPLHSSSIFKINEEGIKSSFENILKIDEKFFVVLSSKKVKKLNSLLKIYFHLSLFDFVILEEVTQIEVDVIELEDNKIYTASLEKGNDNNLKISLNIGRNGHYSLEEKTYNYKLNNGELMEIN